MLAILSNPSFLRPNAALSLRQKLCYTVRKSAEGGLAYGAQTGICRVLYAKPIFVVRVLKDIDTGESIVVCKDASFAKEDNEHYYLIRYTSFCEQVEVDGVLRDKYVRQTRREIDEGTVREVYEDGFPEPKSKPFTYVDDEYAERAIRCSRTYYEYAKDICENYRMDLRRYKLIRERKQYIGISNREAYQAMCEDLAFAQQSLKTVLNDYADLFRKRYSEGLSIRKAADAM